jgi:phage repressor protein C with HTH and peptisase S24 domain
MIDADEKTDKNDPARAARIAVALSMASEKGMNQSDIAKLCKISPQAIYRWKKTGQIGLDHLVRLAALSGASKDWLADGSGVKAVGLEEQRRGLQQVPLISWKAAGLIGREGLRLMEPIAKYAAGDAGSLSVQSGEPVEWVETTADAPHNAYAVMVSGDSMTNPHGSPSMPDRSVVIVDPGIDAVPGNIVVVIAAGESEATIRRLVKDGPQLYLKPLNPAYPLTPFTKDHVICGVAKQVIQNL